MINRMNTGTPDVLKTNRVWSPIYNTLEPFLRSKERSLTFHNLEKLKLSIERLFPAFLFFFTPAIVILI